MGLLGRVVINAIAIAVAAYFIPGISYGHTAYGYADADKWISLALTALVLGIVNAFVRPILLIVSLPITCATLGLFVFVINALMLILVSAIPQLGFSVDGFLWALIASVLISVVSGVLSKVVH